MTDDPTLSVGWVRQWLMEATADFDRGEFMDHVERVVAAVAAAARREGAAEAWDEGAEATAEWMAANPGPSGVPTDPPRNPYDAALRAGDA